MFSPDDALGSILVKSTELGGHVGKRCQTVGVEILVLLRTENTNKCETFTVLKTSPLPSLGCKPTLVRVMLNWMVRMTTRMSKLPREISVSDLSEYHVMFFSTWEKGGGPRQRQESRLQAGENYDTTSWQHALKVNKAPQSVSTHHLVDGTIESIILCENEQNNEGHVDVVGVSVLHMVKDLQDGQNLSREEDKESEYVSHSGESLNLCSNTSDAKPLCNDTVQMSKHKNSHAKICGSWLVSRFQYTVKVVFITTICHQLFFLISYSKLLYNMTKGLRVVLFWGGCDY